MTMYNGRDGVVTDSNRQRARDDYYNDPERLRREKAYRLFKEGK